MFFYKHDQLPKMPEIRPTIGPTEGLSLWWARKKSTWQPTITTVYYMWKMELS